MIHFDSYRGLCQCLLIDRDSVRVKNVSITFICAFHPETFSFFFHRSSSFLFLFLYVLFCTIICIIFTSLCKNLARSRWTKQQPIFVLSIVQYFLFPLGCILPMSLHLSIGKLSVSPVSLGSLCIHTVLVLSHCFIPARVIFFPPSPFLYII